MRVCCFHTGTVQADCAAALNAFAPRAEYVLVDKSSDSSYAQEINRRWDSGDDLVIVEHDNEIREGTLPSFAACPQPWCTFAYQIFAPPWTMMCETGLGCVRFSAALQREFSFEKYILGACDRCGNVHDFWGELDVRFSTELNLRLGLAQPHVHGEIRHFHPYQPVDPDWQPGDREQVAPAVWISNGFRRLEPGEQPSLPPLPGSRDRVAEPRG